MTRELVPIPASSIKPRHRPRQWGPWGLDAQMYTLNHRDTGYEVDLERCLNSAQALDWIAQIARKTWTDDTTIAGLVRAIDDLLNAQAHLCPGGTARGLTRARVRRLVSAESAEREEASDDSPQYPQYPQKPSRAGSADSAARKPGGSAAAHWHCTVRSRPLDATTVVHTRRGTFCPEHAAALPDRPRPLPTPPATDDPSEQVEN